MADGAGPSWPPCSSPGLRTSAAHEVRDAAGLSREDVEKLSPVSRKPLTAVSGSGTAVTTFQARVP